MQKTVLITGGSRGIGAAAAELFAQNGYKTAITYNHSEDKAFTLAEKIGATAIKADISKRADIDSLIQSVNVNLGSVDVLINNAGIAQQKLFVDITDDDWDNMFAVNMRGMFMLTREIARGMINRKTGSIINISSMWGMVGASCEVHYSASKAAVIGFTKALAKELGLSGISVNCIAPGVIDTDMNSNLDAEAIAELKEETPLCRIGTPKDIAESALFLAESRFITGQIISPNGGLVI